MLSGAYVLSPLAVFGQPRALPVVGFLNSTSQGTYDFNAEAFRNGLAETGFVEGRNVVIEYRWADNDYSRLPALAADLVSRKVDVIAATGDIASARAAMGATKTIPIVFTVGADPVRFGLVASLSRPSGNATGITLFSSTLTAKRLELLRDLVPNATLVALLMNPDNHNVGTDIEASREAARTLGRQTVVINARGPAEFDAAFQKAVQSRVGAMLVASDPMFLGQRERLIERATRFGIPVMYWTREFVAAGGLISYGTSIAWMYQEAGHYFGRILRGAKASDLPVLQPDKFYLVVNLKTAKAQGLSVPQSLLLCADDVIQ